MIACISPADTNAEETINTLKYANRARNIQNKAVVNRDPVALEMQRLRSQVEQLQSELLCCRGNGAPSEELQVEKDGLILKIELARNGKSWDEFVKTDKLTELDLVKGYVSKDADLNNIHDIEPCSDGKIEEDEKEREHSSLLDKELQELDKRLEQKREMKGFGTVDLMHHYEKKLLDLEHKKKALQKEFEELRFHLSNKPSSSEYGAQKLTEEKLNMLESQLLKSKKKQEGPAQLLRQRQKSEEASKRLQEEIRRLKSQKFQLQLEIKQLQLKIKQESKLFRAWKASREKEVLQLKKKERRHEYEMHKLLALNQRLKMEYASVQHDALVAELRWELERVDYNSLPAEVAS